MESEGKPGEALPRPRTIGHGRCSCKPAFVLCLLLISGMACTLILGPDEALQASIEELGMTTYTRDQEAAMFGGDVVTVSGIVWKAAPCYELKAAANATRDLLDVSHDHLLTVRVGAEYSERRCRGSTFDVVASSDYRAEVAGLKPGRYRVTVLHADVWDKPDPDTLTAGEIVTVE